MNGNGERGDSRRGRIRGRSPKYPARARLGAAGILPALLAALAAPCCAAVEPPEFSVQAFIGPVEDQKFVTLTGGLTPLPPDWRAFVDSHIEGPNGPVDVGVHARVQTTTAESPGSLRAWARIISGGPIRGDLVHEQRWSYEVWNGEPNLTICGVTFPKLPPIPAGLAPEPFILWPGMYRGARITELVDREGFEQQAKAACKGVPHLFGRYQGDLSMPWFFQGAGPGQWPWGLGLLVHDPTTEVVTFEGFHTDQGIQYQVTTHPRIPTGERWTFGDIVMLWGPGLDWHTVADRHREWLVEQNWQGKGLRTVEPAVMTYGRWDGFDPEEAIEWADALGVRDVLLWVVLYGRGDQYYPCYFPKLDQGGIDAMRDKLGKLRAAGKTPYFYTNGYLLSPLQTAEDSLRWSKEHAERYPEWLAKGDTGYAEVVRQFRQAYDFAGDWLGAPGGILPIRVQRLSFQWGQHPVYFWHQRPFYAACVAAPQWRKLFRDTARLHAEMGAGGIFMDQVGAIHPEKCSARGHGHDVDSFGMWNRAYLWLLQETREAGRATQPGFFIEAEGAADVYARDIDRYLGGFGPPPEDSPLFPQMIRYAVPWLATDNGQCPLDDADTMRRMIADSFLFGTILRVSVGPKTAEAGHLQGEAARLFREALATRRMLAEFYAQGQFRDDVGLTAKGCSRATWFQGPRGALIAAEVDRAPAEVTLRLPRGEEAPASAADISWQTATERPITLTGGRRGTAGLSIEGEGLHLIVLRP